MCAVRRLSAFYSQGVALELSVAHDRDCSRLMRQGESVDFALVLSRVSSQVLAPTLPSICCTSELANHDRATLECFCVWDFHADIVEHHRSTLRELAN